MDEKLFDLVCEEPGFYGAALDTLVAGGVTPSLRLNAQRCKVRIIRQLCKEALAVLGELCEERPVQLSLF